MLVPHRMDFFTTESFTKDDGCDGSYETTDIVKSSNCSNQSGFAIEIESVEEILSDDDTTWTRLEKMVTKGHNRHSTYQKHLDHNRTKSYLLHKQP